MAALLNWQQMRPHAMNGILFLTAPILPTFVAIFGRWVKMLMVPSQTGQT